MVTHKEIFNQMVRMEQSSAKNTNLMQTYKVMWNYLKADMQFAPQEKSTP